MAAGGVVRGFAVPGTRAEASRKEVDGWVEIARRNGAAGVLTLRRKGGETVFQVKNALTDAELQGAAEALGLEEGGLALIVAAPADGRRQRPRGAAPRAGEALQADPGGERTPSSG